MIYQKNTQPSLSDGLFRNPTCEYRGTPFWAWNSHLTADELCRQIDIFKEMGLGGFHMHVRTGLENKYLSDEYMELIKTCVEKAKKEDMLAWLYDEDRWPSGAAGGIVTKDEEYRARCLLFTPFMKTETYHTNDSRAEGGRSGKGKLLACYDVKLNADGYLESYKRIGEDDAAEGTKWYALLEIHTPSSWYNNQTYADTLNKKAIDRFIEVTHERYKEYLKGDFGGTVPAIFTDEPQFTRKKLLNNSTDKMDVLMPWTDSVPETYKETYNEDLMDYLPEVFWDLPDNKVSVHRYRYHDHIAEIFARSFADTVGTWCKENGIALTGHMMEEPTLRSQTAALGEAMRSYRSFGLPGIDMLCLSHEFTTAKQAQSASHQYGNEGVLSELYGVSGWDTDFRDYLLHGDWQACLGVTVRVPHLSWYAMAGEAKRDYPASIHYQSPWYKKFAYVEDHFARVNTAITRGKPEVKVAVIHPVESFWLHWGPNDKSALMRETMDEKFQNLTQWLLEGSVDFDFIAESLLPEQCAQGGAPLTVGEMKYSAIIVPALETMRSTTLDRLEKFREAGGKLIFLGAAPQYENAQPSGRGKTLYEKSVHAEFDRTDILSALESDRTVTIRRTDGSLSDKFIYQMRADNDCKWLFLAHSRDPRDKKMDEHDDLQIILEGEYSPVLYNTYNGDITPVPAKYVAGKTYIKVRVYSCDTLLYKLIPGKTADNDAEIKDTEYNFRTVPAPESYSLSEDNVLVLDMAEYKLDNEAEWNETEEILRLDNICRAKAGLNCKGGHVVQPYVLPDEVPTHSISLKFTINSEIAYKGALLALEDADKADILFNGKKVDNKILGNFTDIAIHKVALPEINAGKNELIVTLPFGERTNTENMFILGSFGVRCEGRLCTLTNLPASIEFGDLTHQGFPFYGGAVTYKFSAQSRNGKLALRASDYSGALICVTVDGKEQDNIVCPPYITECKDLSDGAHTVELTLYTHRYNTFGPLHLVHDSDSHHGPGAWRSVGCNWSYEYILRKTGVMKAPEICE